MNGAIRVAVSSRAIFDLDREHEIYESQGQAAYDEYYLEHEDDILQPGTAYPFIQALEAVNEKLRALNPDEEGLFHVVLMSHNSAKAGIRLLKSIKHHDLKIKQMCLTNWGSVVPYLGAYGIDLLLTSTKYSNEVKAALKQGFAAACLAPQSVRTDLSADELRVAFDCDAVLFSNESDKKFQEGGLSSFYAYEKEHEDEPITEGPLKKFASALGMMQSKFKEAEKACPIKTYIVTARGSDQSSGIRALKTLRSWGLEINELNFLAGRPKGPILKATQAHIFFDDSSKNIASSVEYGIPSGHVDWGEEDNPIEYVENKNTSS